MNKIILVVGAMLMFSGLASAHHKSLVNIEKAHKVIIKSGMSHHEKVQMMKCLVMLKKHKTAEEAIQAKMTKINAKCEKMKLGDKKCHHIKHKIAKKIHACYAVHNFFVEFFHGGEEAAAPVEVEAAPAK